MPAMVIMLSAMLMMIMVMHGDDAADGTGGCSSDDCGINNSVKMIVYVMVVLHGDEDGWQ